MRAFARLGTTLISVALAGAATPSAQAGPMFTGLGYLGGEPAAALSRANAVSADGSVVVGGAQSSAGYEAYRWTAAEGMVGLGDLPLGPLESWANGVSADGSVVVGLGSISSPANHSFRWTEAGGMVDLGDLPGGLIPDTGRALDTSADGSVVVGIASTDLAYHEAYRWTEAGGMVGLGFLPGGTNSDANGVSPDGSIIVGSSYTSSGIEAFRWTLSGGMVGLGELPGGSVRSEAFDLSTDGSVIVGFSYTDLGIEAFRWTAGEGMVGMGFLPGGTGSRAEAVSSDGSIIVGRSFLGGGLSEAFIWDEASGIRSLQDVLANDYGLDLSGWTLSGANDLSGDGRTIVGFGINPGGSEEAWIAVIPEPSTALLLACGVGLLAVRRRLRSV